MHRKLTFPYLLVFSLLLNACQQPCIPISDTLESSLGNKYSSYVELLNNSIEGDTAALRTFLQKNEFLDVAGYDHGYVLVNLMPLIGDKEFSLALSKLSKGECNNVKEYFRVGLDGSKMKHIDSLYRDHIRSFELLGFTRGELKILGWGL